MQKDPRLQRLLELVERQVAAHLTKIGLSDPRLWAIESTTQHLTGTIEAAWPAIMGEDDAATVAIDGVGEFQIARMHGDGRLTVNGKDID